MLDIQLWVICLHYDLYITTETRLQLRTRRRQARSIELARGNGPGRSRRLIVFIGSENRPRTEFIPSLVSRAAPFFPLSRQRVIDLYLRTLWRQQRTLSCTFHLPRLVATSNKPALAMFVTQNASVVWTSQCQVFGNRARR